MRPATRVFVVAPSPLVRAGLRSVLDSAGDAGVVVVGEAPSLSEPAGGTVSGVDVFLLAGEDSIEDAALSDEADAALLALSEDEGAAAKLRALPLRAWGVLTPEPSPEELEAAILAVGQGLVVLPVPLAQRVIEAPIPVSEALSEPLTNREGEVLGAIGRGLSNKMIARELRISEHTVKFHVSSLYAKLGVASRAEAIGQGARLGLISL